MMFSLKFLSTAFFLCYAGIIVCTMFLPHFCPHIVQLDKSDLLNLLYINYLFYNNLIYRLGEDYYLLLIFIIVVLILLVFVVQLFFFSPLAVDRYTDNIPPPAKLGRVLSKKFQPVEEFTPSKDKSTIHCCSVNTETAKETPLNSSNSSNPLINTSPIQIPHSTPNITPNPVTSSATSAISEACSTSPMNETRRRRSSSISLPGSKTTVPLCENEYKSMYKGNKCISPNYEIAKSIVDDNIYRICRIPLSPEQALDRTFLERINKLAQLNHPYLPRYYKAWFEKKDVVSNSFLTANDLSFNNLRQYYKDLITSENSNNKEEKEKEKEKNEENKEKENGKEEEEEEKEKEERKKRLNKCLQLLSPISNDDYDNGLCDSPSTYETCFIDANQLDGERMNNNNNNNNNNSYYYNNSSSSNSENDYKNEKGNEIKEDDEESRKKKKKRHSLHSSYKNHKNYNINNNSRIERVPSLQDFNKDYILYIQIQFFHAPSLKEVLKLHKQLPELYSIRIITEISEALKYLHDLHIRHGNLDSESVYLYEDGSIKLQDIALYVYNNKNNIKEDDLFIDDIYKLKKLMISLISEPPSDIVNLLNEFTDLNMKEINMKLNEILKKRCLLKDKYDVNKLRFYVTVKNCNFLNDLLLKFNSNDMRLSCNDKCECYEIELNGIKNNNEEVKKIINDIKKMSGVVDVRDNRNMLLNFAEDFL